MNGLLSDITKDLIAIVGIVLTALQTVIILVQLWRGRRVSQSASMASSPANRFRLSLITSNTDVLASVAIIAAGFFLSLIAVTTLYLYGLSATTVAGELWYNGAFLWEPNFIIWDHPALLLLFPGVIIEDLGFTKLPIALAVAVKGVSRWLATALVLCYACFISGYIILIAQALHSIHSRWFDLFIMSQTYSLGFLVLTIIPGIILFTFNDD